MSLYPWAIISRNDGVHLHSGNGYLLSQFNSPFANRRTDAWGGDPERRARFLLDVYRAVRRTVGADFPVTARLGVADAVDGGLALADGLAIAKQLVAEGLDGIEVTYGVMTSYRENIRPYAGVGRWRAIGDGMLHRAFARPVAETYYRPFARAANQGGRRHSRHSGRRAPLDTGDGRHHPIGRRRFCCAGAAVRARAGPGEPHRARPARPGRLRVLQHLLPARRHRSTVLLAHAGGDVAARARTSAGRPRSDVRA
jgi:NADH:flavin oxidoreductase / NADH oxidase family